MHQWGRRQSSVSQYTRTRAHAHTQTCTHASKEPHTNMHVHAPEQTYTQHAQIHENAHMRFLSHPLMDLLTCTLIHRRTYSLANKYPVNEQLAGHLRTCPHLVSRQVCRPSKVDAASKRQTRCLGVVSSLGNMHLGMLNESRTIHQHKSSQICQASESCYIIHQIHMRQRDVSSYHCKSRADTSVRVSSNAH